MRRSTRNKSKKEVDFLPVHCPHKDPGNYCDVHIHSKRRQRRLFDRNLIQSEKARSRCMDVCGGVKSHNVTICESGEECPVYVKEESVREKRGEMKCLKFTMHQVKCHLQGLIGDFKNLQDLYNIQPVDEPTEERMEQTRHDINEMMDSLRELKSMVHWSDVKNDNTMNSLYEAKDLLSNIQHRVNQTSSSVHNMVKSAEEKRKHPSINTYYDVGPLSQMNTYLREV